MSDSARGLQVVAAWRQEQQQLQQQMQLDVQGQQRKQAEEHLWLLGQLGAEHQAQCQQALQTLRQAGFQVLLQPAGVECPASWMLAGNCGAVCLQAGHAAAQTGGASGALLPPAQLCLLLPSQQGSNTPVAAAAASSQSPAAGVDAVATIIPTQGRSAAKQQTQPAAAGSRKTPQPRKRKAGSAAAEAADTAGTSGAAETAAETLDEAASVETAAAAEDTDAKYRDSKLLEFGQQFADKILADIEASGQPPDRLEVPQVMQLLQPIVDEMLQENPAALGEPITAEHKAHVATVTWRRGSSICGPMGPAAAAARGGICMDDDEGVLRYEQVEQLFGQLNVAEAAAHLGMGKTKFKALCRQFGIVRWPYREFCSIFLAQEYLDAKAAKGRARDGALMPGRRLLLVHALTLLQQHPNMEFKAHPACVLTQVLHKQKHKKRKVEERHADESAAAVLTHIHAAASSGGSANGSDGSGSA